MSSTKPVNSVERSRYTIPLLIALIAAGLAGNYFKFSILNADFIFGSIFAMLALQFFGFGRGVLAAAIIASYTFLAWNHPYALITMTAETAIVGWLIGRRKINLVMADALYWLLIGIPLGFFFFHFVADFPVSNSLFLMTKQGINGITNALFARLIFTGFTLRSSEARISLRELLSNMFILFVLVPSGTMLILGARADMAETNRQIRTELIWESQRVTMSLENWVDSRMTPVIHLAEMTTTLSPQQIQSHLEQTRLSDLNLLRIAILDRDAIITAISPLIDEFGQSNIGKSFADRPFIPTLKQRLKPMISEVVMARVGAPEPIATILAPIVIKGKYAGYVSGILNLDKIETTLRVYLASSEIRYSLLDKNGNVIVTNRKDQKRMTPFSHHQGTMTRLDEDGIAQWVPPLPPNASTIDLWGKSFYVKESTIGEMAEWKLILEQPVVSFQQRLYNDYTSKFFMLFAILLVTQLFAEFFSRRLLQPIDHLRRLTQDIPSNLVSIQQITWPKGYTLETDQLIVNFKRMTDSLQEKFVDIERINESLEKRIEAGTEELRKNAAFLRDIFENIPSMIFVKEAADLRFVQFSKAGEEFLGYSRNELLCKNDYDLFPKAVADCFVEKDREVLLSGQLVDVPEETIQTRDLGSRILHTKRKPLLDSHGNTCYLLSIWEDITERKQIEATLQEANQKLLASRAGTLNIMEDLKKENETRKKSEAEISRINAELEQRVLKRTAQLEASNKELEAFSYSVSHDLRAPLRHIIGYVDLLNKRFRETLPEEGEHYLNNITNSAREMGNLIDDLLQFSKTSRQELRKADMDMNAVLQEVLDKLKADTEKRKISWSAANLPRVFGDYSLFKQVWINLLENAIKYTMNKDVAEIEIGFTREPDHLVFFVRDNGVGFDMQYAGKLFGVFQRLHSPAEFEGTGIGLANVQRIVHKHGGRVWAEAQPEKGATFYFTVPDSASEDGGKS